MRSLNSPQKSIHLLAEKWGNITSLTASCNRGVIHRNHVLFFTFAHIFLLADSISLKRGQIIFCIAVLLVPDALEREMYLNEYGDLMQVTACRISNYSIACSRCHDKRGNKVVITMNNIYINRHSSIFTVG